MNAFKKIFKDNSGSMLLYVVVFGALAFSFIVMVVSGYSITEYKATVYRENREVAFQIADAGINYYVWHLNQNNNDFSGGSGTSSPYVHEYYNKDGNLIGYYSLNVIPPTSSSTNVVVESTGWITTQTKSRRTIRATLTPHYLTDYAYVSNSSVWLGDGDQVHGRIHSNSGIRFDGTTDAPVTSAVSSYQCVAIHGSGCQNEIKPGIWGDGGPTSFWKFPVPPEDFSGGTAALSLIKSSAQTYGDGSFFSASGKYGWHIHFNSDGTFTASKVSAVNAYKGDDPDGDSNTWFAIDIKTEDPGTTYSIPTNGFIYVDDTLWVDGVLNGKATVGVTIGKSIILPNNLTYLNKDGNNLLGLISGKDFLIPYEIPSTLEVDGALFAGSGAAKRYFYSGDNQHDLLILYGSIASAGSWTWHYVSQGGSVVSGFNHVNSVYDSNLVNNPPLGFPHNSNYQVSSWEEVR